MVIITIISVNIVPRWNIYGRSQARVLRCPNSGQYSLRASVDIPMSDNIHRYQCNNPIIFCSVQQYCKYKYWFLNSITAFNLSWQANAWQNVALKCMHVKSNYYLETTAIFLITEFLQKLNIPLSTRINLIRCHAITCMSTLNV